MVSYDHRIIEAKWQRQWEESGLYRARKDDSRPKYYALTMFPYPSGDLHIGHWYAIAPSDTVARLKRMQGHNVLFPMGFDAFGLPAENAAIKHNVHPWEWTSANIERMRKQLRSMGGMFDWDREVVACLPNYYKWTQWLFLKMYEKGLAYKKYAPVDFCPNCNTTLAREQVVGEERVCERCETPVDKRNLDQWFFRITAYADELLEFEGIDWPERIKTMQRNWIGRSEGVEFTMPVIGTDEDFSVFTTRIDTVFGVSFAVLAPEHPLVEKIVTPENRDQVARYVAAAIRQTEVERLSTARERDGVFTGAYAENPLSGEKIPIYIADYVLLTYGTGAIMGVPAHDERDYDFAKRYDLPIPVVITPLEGEETEHEGAYTGDGTMVSSGPYSGLDSETGRARLTMDLTERGTGHHRVNYRLRDWLISRQRYWGAPIPMVYCDECGPVPVPEKDLPVDLPRDAEFKPTGESPLKDHAGFVNTTCPGCGGPARRETDTMDTFVDSSWYYYRYLSPDYENGPFDPQEGDYWLPVDGYTGGIEHATMHLLYTRFFTKAMRDIGLVDFDEPMTKLFNQGIILGADSEKMSKSRGNVVSPDDLVEEYGADVVRTYLMFMAPWDQGGPWSHTGIEGSARFLQRVWRLAHPENEPVGPGTETMDDGHLAWWVNHTVKRATSDAGSYKFNTMIAALMEMTNALTRANGTPVSSTDAWSKAVDTLLLLLAPIAPHFSEELWQARKGGDSIHLQDWPTYDESALHTGTVTVVVQVNGRFRGRIEVEEGASNQIVEQTARCDAKVQPFLEGRQAVKVVHVPGRLVNFVVSD